MRYEKAQRGGLRTAFLAAVGLMMALGIQTVAAEQCLSDSTDLAGTIGGSPQCADFGRAGVILQQGETGATYNGNNGCFFTVSTTPVGVGDSTSFSVTGDCPAELVLTKGVSGNNSCQFVYPRGVSRDTVQNVNEKGNPVSIKSLTVCTDEEAVPANPKLVLDVRVAFAADDCGSSGAETLQAVVGDSVKACYSVTNAGDVAITGVEVNGAVPLGAVQPGGTVTGASTPVTYDTAGSFSESATATGSYGEILVTSNFDTAVVFVEAPPALPVVDCDDPTQNPADFTGRLVASIDPTVPNRNYECVPEATGADPDVDIYALRAGKIQCLNECVPKPGCEFDPEDPMPLPEGCEQPCETSGAWCTAAAPEGQLPYCWEIRDNPGCAQTPVQPAQYLMEVNKTWSVLRKNPYIMQSCTSSGGRETCITYCFLYPGDVAADVCPKGSWVY